MKLLKSILFILLYCVCSVSTAQRIELSVISSKGGQVIEGAIIYDATKRFASRTNQQGKVSIDSDVELIQVKAKYHIPQFLKLRELTSHIIVMEHDKDLLAAEQKLTYPKKNKLWGNYSEYRANNDLLSYDLSIRVDPEQKFISGKLLIRCSFSNR